jgi:ubiquinone/menaquinone biosynthesis C-methylase UbiE
MNLQEILFWFCVLFSLYVVSKSQKTQSHIEGFTTNNQSFEWNPAYDDPFYIQHYDDIYKTNTRNKYEIEWLIETTKPNPTDVFLDIGSGTGKTVTLLTEKGYKAYGIDQSKAMVDFASKQYPKNEFVCGSATDIMTFDHDTFTYILCTHFTIYEIEDKTQFFLNCFHWLKYQGFLCIHFVDKTKFNTVIPAAQIVPNLPIYGEKRITNTVIEFPDFVYEGKFDFKNDQVNRVETFTNRSQTKLVETHWNIDSKDAILELAMRHGFTKIQELSYAFDSNQYLVILQKNTWSL